MTAAGHSDDHQMVLLHRLADAHRFSLSRVESMGKLYANFTLRTKVHNTLAV